MSGFDDYGKEDDDLGNQLGDRAVVEWYRIKRKLEEQYGRKVTDKEVMDYTNANQKKKEIPKKVDDDDGYDMFRDEF